MKKEITLEDDPELRRLMDGYLDADEAGDKAGYLKCLQRDQPKQYAKLMDFLAQEVGKILREGLQ